ncbi:GGDEF domain-containing protein [Cupriavidus basilensis]|uniref:diguanylate cyclase n=1 Tax=Cupriavidus basilensis TaxID=68895 RepID=A0ABT6AP10_9BURK|nr:GGDEF domain-containing protein [Cupriavidus basilensis]MDF3834317.1 GGDEF domain-containing protein [Cupriavidus basilensis]
MPFKIDLATVLLLHTTSLIAGALGILNIRRKSPVSRGLGRLAFALTSLACGATLAGLGEQAAIPHWLWTHLSLLLGTSGYALLWAGMRAMSGRRRALRSVIVLVPVVWFLAGIVTEFTATDALRASAFHLTAVSFLAASAVEIWKDRRSEPLHSRLALVACLAASAAIYATRLVCIVGDIRTSFDMATAFFLQIFCNFAIAILVIALARERAEADLRLAAQTDALTGVGNRRWFLERLPPRPLPGSAVAILDLDRFKEINDRFGHPAGDRVLTAFAKTVQGHLRKGDVFARYGGEEFVLFLPAVSAGRAMEIAERLRKRAEGLAIDIDGLPVRITVSIGIAWVDTGTRPWEAWIQAADRACYAAKRAGRNRVTRHDGQAMAA